MLQFFIYWYHAPMEKLFDDSPQHPGEYLKEKLSERGWTYQELAAIAGKSSRSISEIARCRSGVSAKMARAFGAAFGNSAEEWLKWDYLYRLSAATNDVSPVEDMARLYSLAPVRDMQRRGWIDERAPVESELRRFFGVESLESDPIFPVALRAPSPLTSLNPAERAWCFRARKLAGALVVQQFRRSRIKSAIEDLRILAAFPKEAADVPKVMSEYGFRFLVVEPLPGCKIDGAAFWIDDASPVIAVSVRFDRNDSFWFTVMHELMHVKNQDAISVDTDLVGIDQETVPVLVEDNIEARANKGAANALIPHRELESFIRRVGPLYSKQRIIQFSHRIKIHPAIVVGHLQKRKEIGYHANREMFAKIRSTITETALTDGWGRTVTIQL